MLEGAALFKKMFAEIEATAAAAMFQLSSQPTGSNWLNDWL